MQKAHRNDTTSNHHERHHLVQHTWIQRSSSTHIQIRRTSLTEFTTDAKLSIAAIVSGFSCGGGEGGRGGLGGCRWTTGIGIGGVDGRVADGAAAGGTGEATRGGRVSSDQCGADAR